MRSRTIVNQAAPPKSVPINITKSVNTDIVISDDLFKFYNDMLAYIRNPQTLMELNNYKKGIEDVEKQLLLQGQTCTTRKLESLQDNLTAIDPTKLKSLLRDNFYDPAIMKEIMCTVNSIYYLQPQQAGAVKPNERIKRWLRELTQIGEESAFGYAFRANFANSKNTFVIKAPRDPNNDLLHEVIVGMNLNSLRVYVPNFAYVFGGFKCTPPIIEETLNPIGKNDRVPISWCNNSNSLNVTYAIYENIAPAVSMRDYVEKCTFEQFLDKYLQILYALMVAKLLLDYSHYDMHPGNVMIKSNNSSQKISIPYTTETGAIEYLVTDGIATIIDYGLSHIKVQGQHLGSFDAIPYGVYPNRATPLHDAYKLLMMCLAEMLHAKNFSCYQKASRLFLFFNRTEPLEQALNKQGKLVYFLPYNDKTRNKQIYHLLAFIRKEIPEYNNVMSNTPRTSRVLGCTGNDICLAEGETVNLFGTDDKLKLDNIFDFYDLVSRLQQEGRQDSISEIIRDFDIDRSLIDAYSRYNQIIKDIEIYFNNESLESYSICGLRCYNIQSPQVYNSYKTFLLDTARVNELFQEAALIYDAIRFTKQWYDDLNIVELDNNYNNLMIFYADFLLIIDGISVDYQYLGPDQAKKLNLHELEVLARS